jgi:hypothetical protein
MGTLPIFGIAMNADLKYFVQTAGVSKLTVVRVILSPFFQQTIHKNPSPMAHLPRCAVFFWRVLPQLLEGEPVQFAPFMMAHLMIRRSCCGAAKIV